MNTDELYQMLEEQYFGESMHERDEIELLPSMLKDVNTFVDVGASLGQYAYFASLEINNGRIVCIEPDPIRCKRLKELSTEWENETTSRFEIINAAVADQSGHMDFFVTNDLMSGGLFQHVLSEDEINWIKTTVDVITLDELFSDTDPDFIKIDVEGAEYRVLQGAVSILNRGHCRFLVEIHPWGDKDIKKMPADVFNLFAKYGYDFNRTHRHWHFRKTNNPLYRWIKNRIIVFVMRNSWLKDILKRIILRYSGSSQT